MISDFCCGHKPACIVQELLACKRVVSIVNSVCAALRLTLMKSVHLLIGQSTNS